MSSPEGFIYYHENRRSTRIIPLRSYAVPPAENKFAGLDYINFQQNNVSDISMNYRTTFRAITDISCSIQCHPVIQPTIVRSIEHQRILQQHDMSLQFVFYI